MSAKLFSFLIVGCAGCGISLTNLFQGKEQSKLTKNIEARGGQ